ncbi:fumarylacetoacetate hydrolase family protein [uncultured Litoreibacter sp.]|uniref:fumarylacetoacetate hydrolase family protein n=1 Tax=uncultured Litoreibacter sp. TaxID=1392394 RepID=UPI0026052054|nr:fumarylacetoacetate hydrolase family protein [uncultured Litoreibacter sp.]
MTNYAIDPPAQATLSVAGSDACFPLRRVFCVGRNYEAHVREMGNDTREPPFFFMKPADAVVPNNAAIAYPSATSELHHEVELVVALGAGGKDVSPEQALGLIWGAAVGIDLTRRDLQAQAKSKGRPWDMAKGFDASAPIAPLVQMADVTSLSSGKIWLSVNGRTRQDANLADMIWPVADCIAHLSTLVELAPGDLIMTGTPAGVAALSPGDEVVAGITGLPDLKVSIAP